MSEPTNPEATYYGLTLAQHRERIRKLAEEKGLKGAAAERIIEKAVALIPTVKVGSAA